MCVWISFAYALHKIVSGFISMEKCFCDMLWVRNSHNFAYDHLCTHKFNLIIDLGVKTECAWVTVCYKVCLPNYHKRFGKTFLSLRYLNNVISILCSGLWELNVILISCFLMRNLNITQYLSLNICLDSHHVNYCHSLKLDVPICPFTCHLPSFTPKICFKTKNGNDSGLFLKTCIVLY